MCVTETDRQTDGGGRDRQTNQSTEGKRKERRARSEKVQGDWRRQEVREEDLEGTREVRGEAGTES